MDISEKRKQLEAVKEARLAKQQQHPAAAPSASSQPTVVRRSSSINVGRPSTGSTDGEKSPVAIKKSRPSSAGPGKEGDRGASTPRRPSVTLGDGKPTRKSTSDDAPSTPTGAKKLPKVLPTTSNKPTDKPESSTKEVTSPKGNKPETPTKAPSAKTAEAAPVRVITTKDPRKGSAPSLDAGARANPPPPTPPEEKKTPPPNKTSPSTSAQSASRSEVAQAPRTTLAKASGPTQIQSRVGSVSITPTTANPITSPTNSRPANDAVGTPHANPTVHGYDLFRTLGTAAGTDGWSASAAALCCFNAKWIFGGESRTILDVTAGRMPYTPNGVESSDDNTAVCVVASYSSAVQDIFGGNGGVDMSAVNGESLAEILHLTSGQLPTEAGLTDYGYNWGSYNNSGNPFRNIAGSLTSREWSIERVVSISKASPGLVMAWLTIPVCDEQADETDGLMASKMVIVATPLVCDSEVTSLVIHPYRPNTVFGGTRSGRLVSWTVGTDVLSLDTRHLRSQATATSGAKHILVSFPRRPSFSTYPSPQAHQGPVLKIAVMGDSNSHHLYSVSQDGKVCTWVSSQPLHPHTSRTAYIGNKAMGSVGLCASFSTMKGSDAMSKVFIGTAGGALLYGSNRDARALELHYMKNNPVASASSNKESPSTSGVWGKYGEAPSMSANSEESSKGNLFSNPVTRASEHGGIVTAVAVQPEVFGLRDSECVLSAASDGSCYAWLEDYAVRLDGFGDVVCALEWSPTMPTLFAAGDASGTLSLWDVSQSITSPIASVSLTHHFSAQTGATPISTVVGIRKGVSDLQGDFDEDDTEDMFHYNKTSGREKNLADEEVSSRITALHFSYSGRWLFAGTAGGFVYAVELSQEFYKE